MTEVEAITSPRNHIVVVGAGLVGAVQALLLSQAGFTVTLLERRSLHAPHAQTSAISSRTVALSNRSWQLLTSAGLWPDIDHCPIKTVLVSEQGKFGSVKLHARKLDVQALGYVLSNDDFERYLHNLLRQEPSISVLESASVVACESTDQSVRLTVMHTGAELTIEAALVIAADGTESAMRRMMGIEVQEHDYQQCAVLATVSTTDQHKQIAFERFTRDGPLALLPLFDAENSHGNRYSMILTAPAVEAEQLKLSTDAELLHLVQKKFGGKLGRFETVGSRFIAPLKLTVSKSQIDRRFILIGNAARTLHPVAGQGMNLALRDVFELVTCLTQCDGVDVSLREFVERRRHDQQLVTRQTDLLARVFARKPWPVRVPISVLTTASFLLMDFVDPVKKSFASMNMGHHVPLSTTRRSI